MNPRIPYYSFDSINRDCQADLETAFHNVLNSKWYILGQCLQEFESLFAEYIQVKHAIGVGNGTDALKMSLMSLELQPGDEVILPSLTFMATLLAVVQTGARPVLADVNPVTYVLEPENIKPLITAKTKVIVPVHLYGYPCNMYEINEIALSKNIYIIEDFAQSVGAELENMKTGSFGHINATSFYPTKTLGAMGDGGMITTNSSTLAERCRTLRNYGFIDKLNHQKIGYNSRLDELQAALLIRKLKYLDQWIDERRAIAKVYLNSLSRLPDLILPIYSEHTRPVYHIFPVRTKKREALQRYLSAAGIETTIHYNMPLHLQESMKYLGYGKNSFPVAEEIAMTELSLPIYPGLSNDKVHYITEKINDFFKSGLR
jgi:dTDP-4-amino-4,6-dideoxygalactose transaminase